MGEIISGNVQHRRIQNSIVGVMEGSIERHLVLQEGGKPLGIILEVKFRKYYTLPL